MKKFLLRCECSADIPVGAGQAGGRATCAACGRSVAVPKLRELERLAAPAAGAVTARPRWTAAHAVALVGAAVALLSWVSALILHASTPQWAVNPAAFRAAVNAASDMEVYAAWKRGTYESVERPPTRDEERLLQNAKVVGGLSRVLWIIGGLGAVTALAGAVAAAAGRPQAAPPADQSAPGPSPR